MINMEEIQTVQQSLNDCGFCPLVSLFDKDGCQVIRKDCCKKYKKKGRHCKKCPKL